MSTFDPSLRKEAPPVVARIPARLTEGVALEVLFRAPDQVDVRPLGGVWTPLKLVGGDVEVRVR